MVVWGWPYGVTMIAGASEAMMMLLVMPVVGSLALHLPGPEVALLSGMVPIYPVLGDGGPKEGCGGGEFVQGERYGGENRNPASLSM